MSVIADSVQLTGKEIPCDQMARFTVKVVRIHLFEIRSNPLLIQRAVE